MERWYRATGVATRTLVRALDVRLHVSGLEHVPTTGPVVLASTHGSYPDFLWIGLAANQRGRWVRFMTRHDVWNSRARRPMDAMRHIPVDREAPAAAYLKARRLLSQGEAVGLFPEAGISFSYAVRSLMPGAAALAREAGAPLVPLALWGSQELWTVDAGQPDRVVRPHPRRHQRIDLMFGEAITVLPGDDLAAATARLGHAMTGLLEGLQRLPDHVPASGEHAPRYPSHLGGHAPTRAGAAAYDKVPKTAVPPTWGPPTIA